LKIFLNFSAAATGAAYPATQAGYAVAPATAAATYGTQRAAGYDPAAYQAAATQGTYAGKLILIFFSTNNLHKIFFFLF